MKVIAIERGFYGGKIQEPLDVGGEPFYLTSESHLGKWMEPQGWKPSGGSKPTEPATGAAPSYTTKHNGGGRHIVIDASGKKVGDFVGANKEEAEAEVVRLLAGGEPFVKFTEPATGAAPASNTNEGAQAAEEEDPGLPDA